MEVAEGRELTAVEHALDAFATGLDHLVKVVEDGGLDAHDDAGLVGFLRAFEQTRNRMSLVDHRVVADGVARGLPDRLTQPSMVGVLASVLRLSRAEASRRVRAAAAVGVRVSMTGVALAPVRSVLAAAQREGVVSPEQVAVVERALASVDRPGFDPADIAAGEELLVGFAATFGPKQLADLADQVVAHIDPDGTRPEEDLAADRRHLGLRRTREGMYVGELRLSGEVGAKLTAILSPLAKPRVETVQGPDGRPVELRDERHYGQRMHDALGEVCDRLLHAGDLPASGGTPTSLIVTIDWEDLLARSGYGVTSDGTLLPVADVLRAAGEAEIVPVVLTASGEVLAVGRSRRVATATQTLALIARDGGCSFPGCEHPAEWCERHHIVAWIDGGETNLDNLTLLCRYHHHNFAQRGWTCELNQHRLPAWRPPRWVDPTQRLIINTRITTAHTARHLRR